LAKTDENVRLKWENVGSYLLERTLSTSFQHRFISFCLKPTDESWKNVSAHLFSNKECSCIPSIGKNYGKGRISNVGSSTIKRRDQNENKFNDVVISFWMGLSTGGTQWLWVLGSIPAIRMITIKKTILRNS